MSKSRDRLRAAILRSLRSQGYRVRGGTITLAEECPDKDYLRSLHRLAVKQKRVSAEGGLRRHQDRLLDRIANGAEVEPERVAPRLVEVRSGSDDELLFRYATLMWSIPVSSGYGRRLRFLVIDEGNSKLIGILGLGDPVMALTARDQWVGWTRDGRNERLRRVMDAFVLGAVPPYNRLLCGKLVALLATSSEVQCAFAAKYANSRSRIRGRSHPDSLAMLTTTSALGRSSIYNRLRIDDQTYWESVGFTEGNGEFHFANGVYARILDHANANCSPVWRHEKWGSGFRNKREVVRSCLADLGLSRTLTHHGVRREVFVAQLGSSAREFLRGERESFEPFSRPAAAIAQAFSQRWLLPRAARMPEFRDFRRDEVCIWPAGRARRR